MLHTLRYLLLTPLLAFMLLSQSILAAEPTQEERNEMAVKLIPIINMLLMGDSTPPLVPTLTTPAPVVAASGTLEVEVNGEVGAKVYVNGVEVGTIGSNGKTTVVLTFVNGVNSMTITLRDAAGNVSEALSFSVSYDAPPVITIEGDVEPYLAKGDTFIDLGATAMDANDGVVSVSTSGTVDTEIIGEHNITYSANDSKGNTATKIRKVHVIQAGVTVEELPMDITKVEGYDGATDLEKLSGIVTNQYWVQDFGTLSEAELRTIVAEYPIVIVVGYSDTYGLLVEIPENNAEANSALKSIELEEKVVNVRHRVYMGADTISTNSISIPNDDVSGYNDGGDNWHLEYINILDAWEITTGSSEVAIGVVDNGFYANHEDITIKDGNLVSPMKKDSHGTACVSIIAADTNNGKGVTGINWKSSIVGSIFKEEGLISDTYYKSAQYFGNIFDASEDKEKVKLVNCSFGPDEAKDVSSAYSNTRPEHDAIMKYKNKLFIFAAGNENVDAELTYGVLHRNAFGKNNTDNDNILIVTAFLKDGTLPYYSNYGETVDIAAPTAMKTAKKIVYIGLETAHIFPKSVYNVTDIEYYGTNHEDSAGLVSSEFSGTSAAAPVVTGVASLIYSLNPDFTPQQVKKILIESATRFVTERHTVKKYDNDEESLIDAIPGNHPIPILDAGEALKMAKEYVDAKKADLVHYYPSAFLSSCNVHVKPATSALVLSSVSLSVKGRKNLTDIWENIGTQPPILSILDDATYEVGFEGDSSYAEYNVSGTVTYEGFSAIVVSTTFENTITEMDLKIEDKITNQEVNDTTVLMEYTGSLEFKKNTSESQLSVDNGRTLYIEKDQGYKIHVTKDGYKEYSSRIGYFSKIGTQLYIDLVPEGTDASGSLYGRVTDTDGNGITNAYATLKGYGDTITTQLVKTGTSGIYRMSDLPMLDTNGEFIGYELNISRPGYKSQSEVIALVDGKSVSENFTLESDGDYANQVPSANAGEDQSITVGQSITLTASASSDDETPNAYLSYEWSGPTIDTSYDETITMSNLTVGVHYIVLKVTDEEGAVATDTVDVTVLVEVSLNPTHNGTTYGTVTSPYTGKVWLDRNLGASQVCTSSSNTACYGKYYQWGRKTDGHQNSWSATTTTRATNVNSAGSRFIKSGGDWAGVDSSGSTRSANWSATDGSSVCPVGYRVPTVTELKVETLDNGVTNAATAFYNFLKVPSAGSREDYSASMVSQGSYVDMWTSSVSSDKSGYIYFTRYGGGTWNGYRAKGFSVRCLRD